MKITRTLTTAAAATVAAALSFAASAAADPAPINGTYAIQGGADGAVVNVASNCDPVVDGCTANVASTVGWTSVATYSNGQWNFTVTKPDGVVCDDGNSMPIRIAYSVNAATMAGTITGDSNGDCPGGQVTQAPFQLVKVG
ncbi:hypothetical protein [Mycolicibacterium sphagni]|uniref:Secreted protein n=1 Tax=Mycolicibacterium sphagni TaxID=1786 RepID=A0A255DRH4_9MYCO|nr:hypothetical protein [Mycolicibacterium sphagni]OYN81271.1 hypothetical protein CG716_07030 [Mycolicibacterium sphagni]